MENLRRKYKAANIIGFAIIIIVGVLFTVFSRPIYDALSEVTFLKPADVENTPEPEPSWDISYGNYNPGIYEASVYGFSSDVKATVEVSETEILSIKVDANGESNIGVKSAVTIKDAVLETQNADVDAVSGATYSSDAVIQAIKDALSQASAG